MADLQGAEIFFPEPATDKQTDKHPTPSRQPLAWVNIQIALSIPSLAQSHSCQ